MPSTITDLRNEYDRNRRNGDTYPLGATTFGEWLDFTIALGHVVEFNGTYYMTNFESPPMLTPEEIEPYV